MKGFTFTKQQILINHSITLHIFVNGVGGFSYSGNAATRLFPRVPLVLQVRLSESVGIQVMLLQKVVQISPVLTGQLRCFCHIPFGHFD